MKNQSPVSLILASVLTTGLLLAQTLKLDPVNPDPKGPRPVDAVDSVWIEDLTWMDVRDVLKAGKTTVIILTGGVEQNSPYLVTGKHNIVLKACGEVIARKLGNALVAPIVAFVPEGNIDPPSLHMKYPGTISLSADTFARLLTDICASFRATGFQNIVLLGDSGGNQKGMKDVAAALNAKWTDGKVRVHFIPEFYNYPAVAKWLEDRGGKQVDEGLHDNFAITSIMMTVDPLLVRHKQRVAAKKSTINGVDIADLAKTVEWGRKVVEYSAEGTVKAIQKAIEK